MRSFVSIAMLLAAWSAAPAATLDFKNAVIVLPANPSVPEKKAAAMLSEEIEKRTQLRPKVRSEPTSGPAFIL
jgi:hypothetical protein